MARWIIPLVLLRLTNFGLAQTVRFQPLRYNEDYRYLYDDSLKSFYEKMKFTSIGETPGHHLSLGGEVRYQVQYFRNEDWGEGPQNEYTAFYTRFLFHTDLHLSRRFRLFTQLNSTFANGRPTHPRPIDENRFDVQQAFGDWKIIDRGDGGLTFRIGRQELLYGYHRLISVREGPNNRRSFDAVKLFYSSDKFTADIFYARPVPIRQGALDDPINRNQQLFSVYSTTRSIPFLRQAELYYIGYWNKQAVFFDGTLEESRHSVGTRIWDRAKGWSYDVEALYQFGSFGNKNISSYAAFMNATYRLHNIEGTTIGLRVEIISGDQDRYDDEINTFNSLFPRIAYFGLAALIGPTNYFDFHPFVQKVISSSVSLTVDYDMFWRHSIDDGVYGPSGALIYPDSGNDRQIGGQLGINIECNPTRHLSISPEFKWFDAGSYLREVSTGKDVFYASVTVQFRY